jgi:membrane protein DedA with SNARE-associated domain
MQTAQPTTPAPPKWVLPVALVPILAVVIAGYVAGAMWATLLKSHPLVLIALSPINRHLLLTTNHLDTISYFAVGMGRHLLPDPFFYLLGYWYGDRALKWASEVYPSVHRLVGEDGRGLEDPSHRRILYPLAFFMPNNWVSLVSGSARIPAQTFIALNVAGTAARLGLCRWLGSVFTSQIESIASFVSQYQWPVTIASMALVGVGIAMQLRKGTGELLGLTHLADELEEG